MADLSQRFVRRLGRSLPSGLQDLSRAVRAAHRGAAVVEVPRAEAALFIGAHPDDETSIAGGTIAVLAAHGSRVDVVLATAGEATAGADFARDQIRDRRSDEARAACEILGAEEPTILGYPDGSVAEHVDALARDVSRIVADMRPQLVFAPWWLDGHPDHQAVAAALVAADVPASTVIWSGETWTPLIPNRIVDITGTVERKRAAIGAHRTASESFDLGAILGLNRYRSMRGLRGVGYAEAFVASDPVTYRSIVEDAHG